MLNQVMELAFYTVWVVVGITTLAGYAAYYPLMKKSLKFTEEMFNDSDKE